MHELRVRNKTIHRRLKQMNEIDTVHILRQNFVPKNRDIFIEFSLTFIFMEKKCLTLLFDSPEHIKQ